MSRDWCRVYTDITTDPKLRGRATWERWTWVGLLVMATKSLKHDPPIPGTLLREDGRPAVMKDIAQEVGVSNPAPAIEYFLSQRMLVKHQGCYVIVKFRKRQPGLRTQHPPRERALVHAGAVPQSIHTTTPPPHPVGASHRAAPAELPSRETAAALSPGRGVALNGSHTAPRLHAPEHEHRAKAHPLMVEALGTLFNANSRPEWVRMATAAKILLSAKPPATPDELPALRLAWDALYPNTTCTEMALANRLGQLRQGAGPAGRKVKESPTEQLKRVLGPYLEGGDDED